ncbi:MAG: TPM domain-containing protein [Oscillatoria sp. PMC 1051.18]|uniref:TPM domain-containing protein n=1 Tax=Oscillatoria salina TaxID=331517 RepID=UPI0013BB15BF|nr:TPM domain-containing protein [Oscillatoria salina]MBZ8182259.1 TPM domain-containing protein [Oscillatoria salina IIICB1]MEC4896374.1 TPM domain-containing protein [Oscillatoria sp. PMC 1050.18]MEC5030903.1 TPM domain-containing protein [Oscillatoria sp. PMC 1051.18]NET91024.1 TPM domain-containing protein [Kamptonema sp. SIO1D9]
MQHRFLKRLLLSVAALVLALSTWAVAPAAWAFDNPELLPNYETPIIDLANFLPSLQEETLAQEIKNFEAQTGWKLRVLTQYDQTPGRAVKNYWGLDDKSVLLVADGRGGNLLAFNVGDDVYQLLPRTFWVELQTRFGNLYFVRDNGENNSIAKSLDVVKQCLSKGGCGVVPGLPREQWILTLITSVIGGVVFGLAAIPRKKNQIVAWQWALIFSPLWGILFVAFGIGPVVTRTSEFLPLFRNIIGFVLGALVAYLSPVVNQSTTSET